MTGAGPGADQDVAASVQTELDRALRAFLQVHTVVQDLADETAVAQGLPRMQVPDLGPAVLMDQLRVMVHDWRAAGLPLGSEDARAAGSVSGLEARLTALRRSLP